MRELIEAIQVLEAFLLRAGNTNLGLVKEKILTSLQVELLFSKRGKRGQFSQLKKREEMLDKKGQ